MLCPLELVVGMKSNSGVAESAKGTSLLDRFNL